MATKRITLAELAAKAAAADNRAAWTCPACGCNDWRVVRTQLDLATGFRKRERACRYCGRRLPTLEMPVSKKR